jgi:hypothetical protein
VGILRKQGNAINNKNSMHIIGWAKRNRSDKQQERQALSHNYKQISRDRPAEARETSRHLEREAECQRDKQEARDKPNSQRDKLARS